MAQHEKTSLVMARNNSQQQQQQQPNEPLSALDENTAHNQNQNQPLPLTSSPGRYRRSAPRGGPRVRATSDLSRLFRRALPQRRKAS